MNLAIESAFYDELEKIAAAVNLSKSKGIKRVGELLTGSRVKKLEAREKHLHERGEAVEHAATNAERKVKQEPGESAMEHWRRQKGVGYPARAGLQDAKKSTFGKITDEERSVETARTVAGAGAGTALGTGIALHRHKKKQEASKEKVAKGFDGFMGGGAGAKAPGISATPRSAPSSSSVAAPAPKTPSGFTPAVVGTGRPAPMPVKKPLPTGALNPGGGFH